MWLAQWQRQLGFQGQPGQNSSIPYASLLESKAWNDREISAFDRVYLEMTILCLLPLGVMENKIQVLQKVRTRKIIVCTTKHVTMKNSTCYICFEDGIISIYID